MYRQWKLFIKINKKTEALYQGNLLVLGFISSFFTHKTDLIDIYASCINKKKIPTHKVKKFTLAIESSIKANLRRIMLKWR